MCKDEFGLLWLVLVAFSAHGCGTSPGTPAERLSVTGSVVSTAGEDVSSGSILFQPIGTLRPSLTTSIVDGKYKFDAQNGPNAGSYRVIVDLTSSPETLKASKPGKFEVLQSGQVPDVQPDDASNDTPRQWSFEVTITPDSRTLTPFSLNEASRVKE